MTIRGTGRMGEGLLFDHIIKYKAYLELVTPLHVGASFSERNEVLLHPTDGMPFIQASSLAGTMRDYFERDRGLEKASQLFGSSETQGGSRIVVTDGYFEKDSVRFEMRPRVKIDPVSGTVSRSQAKGTNVSSGHKFDMECIGAGSRFSFTVYIKGTDYSDSDDMIRIFSALDNGGIKIGGQKSNGFGDVRITKLLCKKFDLKKTEDRRAWRDEELLEDSIYEDIISNLSSVSSFAYRITAKAKTEGGILIKGYKKEGFGENGPDVTSIQDAKSNYIVPGSSLKGAVRNQIERMLDYKGLSGERKNRVITEIFGESEAGGKAGNVICYDARISIPDGMSPNVTNRIHIDKITGGVMNTGLFNELSVFGDIEIGIDITERNNPELSCGFMIMAIRDLALNIYNLGSEYSIGNGMLIIEKILIESKHGSVELDIKENRISDDIGIVRRCIKATGEV